MTDNTTKISNRPRTMLIAKINFEKNENFNIKEEFKPTASIMGPVVVKQATARTIASSNNIPNIARIIVTKAKLTIKSMKKIHAIKREILRRFRLVFVPGVDEG